MSALYSWSAMTCWLSREHVIPRQEDPTCRYSYDKEYLEEKDKLYENGRALLSDAYPSHDDPDMVKEAWKMPQTNWSSRVLQWSSPGLASINANTLVIEAHPTAMTFSSVE